MHWYDVLPSNWAVLFHLGTSRPGSGRLGQDENAVVMVFLDASDNYLSPSEGDENTEDEARAIIEHVALIITYLRVKKSDTM